jgi:predicted nuclease of predicted toxin-antitoxin system
MSLLFDENLSPRLVQLLADLFPGSVSVEELGMRSATDAAVWERAKGDGLAIVTRDDDFVHRGAVFGHPPKDVWVALGNCSTGQLGSLLRWRVEDIRAFLSDPSAALLELR